MIPMDIWVRLSVLKKLTNKNMILIGDNQQCAPVEEAGWQDYFNHPTVRFLANYNRITIKECMRYEQKLWDVSQEAYE